MIADYRIKLYNCNGTYNSDLYNYISLTIGQKKNDIGTASLILSTFEYDENTFEHLQMMEIYRDGALLGETLWFIKGIIINDTDETIEILLYDSNYLLKTREMAWFTPISPPLVQYPTTFQGFADDIMKYLVQHSMGQYTINATDNPFVTVVIPPPAAVLTARVSLGNNYRVLQGLTVDPITSSAQVITLETSKKNLLDALKDAVSNAATLGDNLWFDITYAPNTLFPGFIGTWEFHTYLGTKGEQRNIIFGKDYGNLTSIVFEKDFTEAVSVVYQFGQVVVPLPTYDNQISGVAFERSDCITGVIERIQNNDKLSMQEFVDSEAAIALKNTREQYKLSGEILQLPDLKFLIDYQYGDKVLMQRKEFTFVAEIDAWQITLENNHEKIDIALSSTDFITESPFLV